MPFACSFIRSSDLLRTPYPSTLVICPKVSVQNNSSTSMKAKSSLNKLW